MIQRILISAFVPFASFKDNSSQEILQDYKHCNIKKVFLPVSYEKSFILLKEEIDEYNPSIILMLGQASTRKTICLEKIAVNNMNASIEDNDGKIYYNKKIIDDAPNEFFSTINIDEICSKINNQLLKVSYSAGTYVCNCLFYRTMNYIKDKNIKATFIHFPLINDINGISKNEMIKILDDIIKFID